jgi:hypothetical protein
MRTIFFGLALATHSVHAIVDTFYFAGTGKNASALRLCGNLPYACEAPNMCAQDTANKKYYCCEAGSTESPCWKGRDTCMGGNASTPSEYQLGCIYRQTSGDVKYCCSQEELCTLRDRKYT